MGRPQASIPTRHGAAWAKKPSTLPRLNLRATAGAPSRSIACTWKKFFARSIPILIKLFMDGFPIRDLPSVTPWHLMPFGRGRPHHHREARSDAAIQPPCVPLDCFADGVDGPSCGIGCARVMVVAIAHGGAVQMNVTMIGFDIAKGVVQVHGVEACGQVALRKRLSRAGALAFFERLKPCVVGLEACGGAHYWARELRRMGHEARLIAPHYVKPYVKRSKTDAADAAGICEAVGRPHMRFVQIKSLDEQALAQAHKARTLLVAQRTALVNALRAHLTEFGIVAPVGPAGSARLIDCCARARRPFRTWRWRRSSICAT